MKAVVKENEPVKQEKKYPWIGKYFDSEFTFCVLFKKHRCGSVIYTTNSEFAHIGEYSENWVEHVFEPFPGTIELSND